MALEVVSSQDSATLYVQENALATIPYCHAQRGRWMNVWQIVCSQQRHIFVDEFGSLISHAVYAPSPKARGAGAILPGDARIERQSTTNFVRGSVRESSVPFGEKPNIVARDLQGRKDWNRPV